MQAISKRIVALAAFACAITRIASAQGSEPNPPPPPDVPDAVVVTNGIEHGSAKDSVVSLPNPSCPLTKSQVNAVRTAVGSAFVGGNAYLYHYFKKAWWSGERAPHFFFHADWDQWFRDQDKFGHMFGGYHLARPANSVSVADVIVAVDEPIDATKCGGKENCHDDKRCMTHELWANLNVHIFAYLKSVTLEQLVRQQDKQAVAVLKDQRLPTGTKPEPAEVV